MKKIYLLLFFAFGFVFYGASAKAEEYLFSFNGPAVMPFSADNTIEAVNAEHGLYSSSDEEYLKELLNAGIISYYEPMGFAELFDYVPEDKYYVSNQKAYMDMINVPFAWNRSNFGQGVKIAVIDSGLSSLASEFPSKYVTRAYDYINPDAPPSKYCEDENGHGTFVAGIISAEHNARGVTGISPFSKLYIFRCFDSGKQASYKDIIDAIYKAVDEYGCDIINMSLGGNQSSTSFRKAIDYAYSKGVLIVAAAGNDGPNSGSRVYYPAAYDNVICVGSVRADGHRAAHSQKNDYVNIMAPGESVWSVSLNSAGYGASTGTSYAAPHVTAAAALAKSLNPELTNEDLMDYLYLSADAMTDRFSGHGLLNVQSLLTLCRSSLSPDSLIYSVSGKNIICATTPSEGFTSFMAVYDGGQSLKSVSSNRLVILPSPDFDKLRLFIWKRETLVPSGLEISKTLY